MVIKQALRNVLEIIEKESGFELYITSGARCETYNGEITKNKNSAHCLGLAADIAVGNANQRYVLNKILYQKEIKRMGRNNKKNFTHIDVAAGKLPYPTETLKEYPQDVDWDYDD